MVAGIGWKLDGNDTGMGKSLESVITSTLMVNFGDGNGACCSNLLPVHSRCGMADGS